MLGEELCNLYVMTYAMMQWMASICCACWLYTLHPVRLGRVFGQQRGRPLLSLAQAAVWREEVAPSQEGVRSGKKCLERWWGRSRELQQTHNQPASFWEGDFLGDMERNVLSSEHPRKLWETAGLEGKPEYSLSFRDCRSSSINPSLSIFLIHLSLSL